MRLPPRLACTSHSQVIGTTSLATGTSTGWRQGIPAPSALSAAPPLTRLLAGSDVGRCASGAQASTLPAACDPGPAAQGCARRRRSSWSDAHPRPATHTPRLHPLPARSAWPVRAVQRAFDRSSPVEMTARPGPDETVPCGRWVCGSTHEPARAMLELILSACPALPSQAEATAGRAVAHPARRGVTRGGPVGSQGRTRVGLNPTPPFLPSLHRVPQPRQPEV